MGVTSSEEFDHGQGRRVFPCWEMKNLVVVAVFGAATSSRELIEAVLGQVRELGDMAPERSRRLLYVGAFSSPVSMAGGGACVGSYGGGSLGIAS